MSASLVGSEMCIRDSLKGAVQPGRSACAGAPPAARDSAGQLATRAEASPCLLYTSDAADDIA
eukprot:5805795-Alexandrium_andersonii.AAC.1